MDVQKHGQQPHEADRHWIPAGDAVAAAEVDVRAANVAVRIVNWRPSAQGPFFMGHHGPSWTINGPSWLALPSYESHGTPSSQPIPTPARPANHTRRRSQRATPSYS
ncbi:hypothetical protein EV356DRAFT_533775 [Viridothelium virens]|uniref:Uncharacterized protein n=1 Tax=Viridothelium virens TaxID=1048519 RepID=A0A6A6H5H2_VIRVR|nr:hypothetical protein EV356DRAFT_533775 [Viridothelium virens]